MVMRLSPILVGVYDRSSHFEQCINSLLRCPEADETTIFIASDAASRGSDEENVSKVRSFARGIRGFAKVELIEREVNYGAHKNWTGAIDHIFKNFDRLIVLEDDVIVGSGFLYFINSALEKFKDDPRVVGACAYLPPGVSNPLERPFFMHNRAPYGFGFWREKEMVLDHLANKDYIAECFRDPGFFVRYERVNPHVARSIPMMANGDSNAGDIVTSISMLRNGMLAIYPPVSISKSIGNDGSGLHAGENKALQNQVVSNERFCIPESLSVSLDRNMEIRVAKYLSFPGALILNYFVYLTYRFVPQTYPFYKMARQAVKRIRGLL